MEVNVSFINIGADTTDWREQINVNVDRAKMRIEAHADLARHRCGLSSVIGHLRKAIASQARFA